MGGMIAQALAVAHPSQVSRLILAATQPGTGHSLPIPAKARAEAATPNPATVLEALFQSDERAVADAYVEQVAQCPGFDGAPARGQDRTDRGD
jgi:pimeloyl-ACP methyl ester carboxylesterase